MVVSLWNYVITCLLSSASLHGQNNKINDNLPQPPSTPHDNFQARVLALCPFTVAVYISGRSSRSKSLAADRQAELLAAHIRVHGLASVRVKLSALFTGAKTIHSRLDTATGTVEDLVVTLSVDTALLSEPQRMALNPMIINVSSACNMPSRPMSYAELQKR